MVDVYQIDRLAHEAINCRAIPGLVDFFTVVTQFGSAAVWVIAFTIYLLLGKNKLIGAVFILALLFSTVINEDIKDLVRRDRPEGAVVTAYISPINYSFPSQHAQTAFLLATLAAAYFGWKYGLITYPAAALIALSRMYLGVHYLTDVIGGALVGFAVAELIILALYINGMAVRGGVLSYLARLAGIRPPAAPVEEKQKWVGVWIVLGGLCLAAAAMLVGLYVVSLVIMIVVLISIILLPYAYPKYGV